MHVTTRLEHEFQQRGLLRTYALAFTVAVAVLTLVFLVVR